MQNGKTPYEQAPFMEKCWDHHFYVTYDGFAYARSNDADDEELVDRVQHWGRWQTCTKCDEYDIEGVRRNTLTFRGFLVYGTATLVIAGVVALLSGHIQLVW